MKHTRSKKFVSRGSQSSEMMYMNEDGHHLLANKSLYRESLVNLASLPKQTFFAYIYCFLLILIVSLVSSLRPFLIFGMFFGVVCIAWNELNQLASRTSVKSRKSKNSLLVRVDMKNNTLEALRQLKGLTEEDIIWMSEVGSQRRVLPGEILIHEKQPLDSLHIILSGIFEVSTTTNTKRFTLRKIASSEVKLSRVDTQVLGEMSFLSEDSYLPSATVKSVAESWVWSISKSTIEDEVARNSDFGVRFYKVLGSIVTNRLRSMNELRAVDEREATKEQGRPSIFHQQKVSTSSPYTAITPGMALFMMDSCPV